MQKASLFLCFLFILGINGYTQQPVSWNYATKKLSANSYELHITASIAEGWHIYAQTQPSDAIALPTTIQFNRSPLVLLQGTPREKGHRETYTNKEIGISAYQYKDTVEFVQLVKLKSDVKTNLNCSITFQACTEQQCLPPATIAFTFALQ